MARVPSEFGVADTVEILPSDLFDFPGVFAALQLEGRFVEPPSPFVYKVAELKALEPPPLEEDVQIIDQARAAFGELLPENTAFADPEFMLQDRVPIVEIRLPVGIEAAED
jgi:hypothetical protein